MNRRNTEKALRRSAWSSQQFITEPKFHYFLIPTIDKEPKFSNSNPFCAEIIRLHCISISTQKFSYWPIIS